MNISDIFNVQDGTELYLFCRNLEDKHLLDKDSIRLTVADKTLATTRWQNMYKAWQEALYESALECILTGLKTKFKSVTLINREYFKFSKEDYKEFKVFISNMLYPLNNTFLEKFFKENIYE